MLLIYLRCIFNDDRQIDNYDFIAEIFYKSLNYLGSYMTRFQKNKMFGVSV